MNNEEHIGRTEYRFSISPRYNGYGEFFQYSIEDFFQKCNMDMTQYFYIGVILFSLFKKERGGLDGKSNCPRSF